MSSIVVGSGILAETMAGLLCAAGRRVSLVSPSLKLNTKKFDSTIIRSILQEDSEKKIPFEFIDDIKQQQILAEKNFKKIQITSDFSNIEEAEQIIDASLDDEANIVWQSAKISPNATIISLNEKQPINQNHVSVKMYNPITETKTAKLISNSKISEKAIDEVNKLLNSMGFTILSEKDSLIADRFVKDMQQVEKSSELSKLASVLIHPLTLSVTTKTPKDQYQLYW